MAQQRARRERPTLDRLTNDAFRRLGEKHYNTDGSVYLPHDASWDTAHSVEDPIQTHANLQKENPFPPQTLDSYVNHRDARNWDELAQQGIHEIVSAAMNRTRGAKQRLFDQRYDEASNERLSQSERK